MFGERFAEHVASFIVLAAAFFAAIRVSKATLS
jgi:hypothetical protein